MLFRFAFQKSRRSSFLFFDIMGTIYFYFIMLSRKKQENFVNLYDKGNCPARLSPARISGIKISCKRIPGIEPRTVAVRKVSKR